MSRSVEVSRGGELAACKPSMLMEGYGGEALLESVEKEAVEEAEDEREWRTRTPEQAGPDCRGRAAGPAGLSSPRVAMSSTKEGRAVMAEGKEACGRP